MQATDTSTLLADAVYGHRAQGHVGILDRLFARWFERLVYTQIWEDPACDLEAMAVESHHRIITIASAGCNALAYLLADPAEVVAVDLNRAHLALLDLKAGALRAFDHHQDFLEMFGRGHSKANIARFRQHIAPLLSVEARRWWMARDAFGRPRISMFTTGLHRHGLTGRFIGIVHAWARLRGVRLEDWTLAKTPQEQAVWFDTKVARLFDGALVRRLAASPPVVWNLGIPPSQHEALCDGEVQSMAGVLRERARRLATIAPVADNWFAWQAFARRYNVEEGPLPPYLEAKAFGLLKTRVDRLQMAHENLRVVLTGRTTASLDRFVLLDAQDWMSDDELVRLWQEITRTARPGARVIFRTAGVTSPLERALPRAIAERWRADHVTADRLHARDRSAIYGGFHLMHLI